MDTIARCRGSISLARRAPDDVLAIIFEHCAAGGWANAPLVLSHVCAKWRRASFVPRVWSHIHLTSESLHPVAKTRLWLSRALQSPLFVTVDVRVLKPHILDAFGLILGHAPQWRTLTLNTRFVQQANDIISKCIHFHIPYLHTLDITSFSIGFATEQGVDELAGLHDAFADASSLSHIRVVSNRFPPSLPQTVAELSLELHDVVSSSPSLSAILQILGTLPALRSLTFVITPPFAGIIYNDEHRAQETCLHYLERLIIDAPPVFDKFLQHIQTPALQYLHLRSIGPPLGRPHEGIGQALFQFIRSSNPPIKVLELHDVDIRDDFEQCFLSMPLLEELRLHGTELSNDALLSLLPTGACPRFKRIDLR
ncbi:hypothetical protein F5148DRAFT_583179 [Russula earlei]|uniref:Uncharacterized protein n=1 Tax=Russula earlei TaxID=71964 RepID=A0ACC0UFS4_9AGAM|nr:hypothetical protein F5148DRAFT_583179 [Russula earlei]